MERPDHLGTKEQPTNHPRWKGILRIAVIGYIGTLVCSLLLTRLIGERYWLTSIALFVPAQLWLLPLFVLVPALCFASGLRKFLWLLLGCVGFVFFCYMPFHVGGDRTPKSSNTLSILSNNIGQRKTRTMWPFLRSENPDIFVLQEAWHHKRAISSENPQHYVASQGEFVLASRYEIKNSGFVTGITNKLPIAAWFELDYRGQPLVIYNVHMPTPRGDFLQIRGRGIFSGKTRAAFKESLQKRNELSLQLLEHLKAETRPFIVAGDFNMPDTGYLRRQYAELLTDTFAESGSGYGLTFPGISWNPLTLFGPWLRIDYIFTSKHWTPLSARREPRQPAQHLSVSAKLELN